MQKMLKIDKIWYYDEYVASYISGIRGSISKSLEEHFEKKLVIYILTFYWMPYLILSDKMTEKVA